MKTGRKSGSHLLRWWAKKGAAMTSLIHYFVNEKNLEVVWLKPPDEASDASSEHLLNIFRNNLEDDSIVDFEQLTEKLLAEKTRRVFILEGLQFLFLRKVNGFESLKKLIQLISDTQKQVFWITSCTLYAWQYLIKTMQIHEYFGYTVTLGELSDKEMVELIQKRHKVSGYNLEFVPSASEQESSKFQKMAQTKNSNISKKNIIPN